MPVVAANLVDAAHLTALQFRKYQIHVAPTNLKNALATYLAAVDTVVPDSQPNNRPIGNWLIPLGQIQEEIPLFTEDASRSYVGMNQAADIVAKLCWAASKAFDAGLITNAQKVALLAAWNTAFSAL